MVILLFPCRIFRFCMCFVVLNRETLTINKRKLFAEKYSWTFSLELAFQRTIFYFYFAFPLFLVWKKAEDPKPRKLLMNTPKSTKASKEIEVHIIYSEENAPHFEQVRSHLTDVFPQLHDRIIGTQYRESILLSVRPPTFVPRPSRAWIWSQTSCSSSPSYWSFSSSQYLRNRKIIIVFHLGLSVATRPVPDLVL